MEVKFNKLTITCKYKINSKYNKKDHRSSERIRR